MSLRELAERDLRAILNARTSGFGWPLTLTDPDGVVHPFNCRSSDISASIDPDTGQIVSGRLASVSVSMRELATAGLSLPRNIADKTSKPWLVTISDTLGTMYTFKVAQSLPDRTLGLHTLMLEAYEL